MSKTILSFALMWAISPMAVGAEVTCPSPENLHTSYEDSVSRFCDAQWQRRVTGATSSVKSFKNFSKSCMRKCLPKAEMASKPGGHSSGLLVLGGLAALGGIGAVAAGGHGGGKPASP